MLYFKCLCAILVLIPSVFITRKYNARCHKKCAECQHILSFLRKIRANISVYLLPPSKWKRNFAEDGYEPSGFFSALASGKSMGEAYRLSEGELTVPEEIRRELSAFFSDFGRGYMNDELRKLDSMIATLEGALPRLTESAKNESRAAGALIMACALGAVILFL